VIDNKLVKFSCPFCCGCEQQLLYQYDTYAGSVLGEMSVTIVVCKSCSLVYNTPRPSKIAINRHYEESSSGSVFHENYAGSRHATLDI